MGVSSGMLAPSAASACTALTPMALTTVLSNIPLLTRQRNDSTDDIKDDGDAEAVCVRGSWLWWRAGERTIVAVRNPATAATPTPYQGYSRVQAPISAADFAVSCIATSVCRIATCASAACCCKKVASSCTSYCRSMRAIRDAVSELGTLS